jgi:hypothetical protein
LQYRRKYDQAKTPFDRLKEKSILKANIQLQLEALRGQTNPISLHNQVDALNFRLLSLSPLDHEETVNVFETLIKEADSSVTLSFEPMMPFRYHYLLT